MTDKTIKLNEASLEGIESSLIEFLERDASPFKGYNFRTGALSGFIRIMKFVVRNLSFQLNQTVSEIFMDTATLEDSIYSLMQNFNYLPILKRPAMRNLYTTLDLLDITYTPQAGSSFKFFWNTGSYNTDANFIPTFRDKWQESFYSDASLTAFQEKNLFYSVMERYTDSTQDYLFSTGRIYQAEWDAIEETVDLTTFTQTLELKDSASEYYGDDIITDSIRVFVKKNGTSIWREYKNLRKGFFDDSLYTYNLKYLPSSGISAQFGIDNLSRSMENGDVIRVFFAVTAGNEINDKVGVSTLTNADFVDASIREIMTDGTVKEIFASATSGGSTIVSPTGHGSAFSASIVDGSGDSALFDNGTAKQSLESIKLSAPLFRTTQGRAVTEDDYNYILGMKFSEYKGINAWSGAKEFIDIESLMIEAMTTHLTQVGSTWSGTETNMLDAMKEIHQREFKEGKLSVDTIDSLSISSGKYRRDFGFVYYTMFGDGFEFMGDNSNISEIVEYLDEFKILTIYYRYVQPIFVLLKPSFTITLNPSYAKTFSSYDLRWMIYDYINARVDFENDFDMNDLRSYILSQKEIEGVDIMTYTTKIKLKNPSTVGEDIYCRVFTRFSGNINAKIKVWRSGVYTEVCDITTANGKVSLAGAIQNDSTANLDYGMLKFKNYSDSSSLPYFTDDVFYIDDIQLVGNKINVAREAVVGCESVEDINLIVE